MTTTNDEPKKPVTVTMDAARRLARQAFEAGDEVRYEIALDLMVAVAKRDVLDAEREDIRARFAALTGVRS